MLIFGQVQKLMILENKKIKIVKLYFEKLDQKDSSFLDLFTNDMDFYFPKFGKAQGKKKFKEFGAWMQLFLSSISHDIKSFNIMLSGNHVIVEGKESGTTKMGQAWPDGIISYGMFCGIFEFEKDLIKRYYIYVDPDFLSQDVNTIQRFRNK